MDLYGVSSSLADGKKDRMDKILISVIIPVYNVIEYLDNCLQSVKLQTMNELEVILVDDGSMDGSEKLCDRYAKEDPRFRVIHQKNAGASAARNRGIEAARGECIAFLDSDDWLEPDAYETLYRLMECEKADIVFGLGERLYRKELNETSNGETVILQGKEILDTYMRDEIKHPYIQKALWDKLYRREVIGNLRLPENIIMGEDGVFNTKVFCRASKVAFISKVIYHYRDERPGNVSSTRITDRIFADRIPAMLEQIDDLCKVERSDLARYKTLAFYRELQRLYWKTYNSNNPNKKQIMEQLFDYIKRNKEEVRKSYSYEGASCGYRVKMEIFLVCPFVFCLYMKVKTYKK